MADGRLVVVPDSVDDVLLAVVCSSEVDAKIVEVSVADDELTTVGVSLLAVVDDDLVDDADTENRFVLPGEATGVLLE